MNVIESKTPRVLVMTATFRPVNVPYLALTDETIRISQYFCALVSWITRTNFQKIVFCENSGTNLDLAPLHRFAANHGKILEVLVFQGSSLTSVYGKGYGEGEILKYVLENSVLLRDEASFAKVTGRLFVNNLPVVFNLLSVEKGFFHKEPSCKTFTRAWLKSLFRLLFEKRGRSFFYKIWITLLLRQNFVYSSGYGPFVDTRFFLCEKSVFQKKIVHLFKFVRDHYAVSLEDIYNLISKEHKKSCTVIPLEFLGVSATINKMWDGDYDAEIKRTASTLMKSCL